jgi:hypothetical protein
VNAAPAAETAPEESFETSDQISSMAAGLEQKPPVETPPAAPPAMPRQANDHPAQGAERQAPGAQSSARPGEGQQHRKPHNKPKRKKYGGGKEPSEGRPGRPEEPGSLRQDRPFPGRGHDKDANRKKPGGGGPPPQKPNTQTP